MRTLFDYGDYKTYLNDRLDGSGRRGVRSALARHIRCQSAYVSSVLRGAAHFTPEQGEGINEFYEHSDAESDFFLLLLQSQRAGTESLRRRLKRQLEKIRDTRFDLKKRLVVNATLGLEDQATYYSEWYYSAIHALVSIPGFQTPGAIAARLKLDSELVAQAIEFLLDCGILVRERNVLKIGLMRIHLGSESPLISKHHANWRLQALQNVGKKNPGNLHYTSAISVSKSDRDVLKDLLIETIGSAKKIIRDSKEETLCCFGIDFFDV